MKSLFFFIAFFSLASFGIEQDKILHFTAGYSINLSCRYVLHGSKDEGPALCLIGTTAIAVSKEFFDKRFDEKDVLATVLGGVTSSLFLLQFSW